MKLSIITVNLNNRDGLQKTIDSVVSQTFKDFEWIVIDGGSTDGSKELIERYSDHFAYWVSEPDKGIYNAMNKGIKVAKGEYLQFLNSGDWLWENDTLQKMFSIPPIEELIFGDCLEANGIRSVFPHKIDIPFLYKWTINHQSTLIKSCLLKTTGYDETYKVASDWKFFLNSIIFNNASYRKIDIIVTGVQEGHSYDTSLSIIEREEILEKTFSPLLRKTIETNISLLDNPMYHYFEYIQNNKKLAKMVRRIVRLNKMLHHS